MKTKDMKTEIVVTMEQTAAIRSSFNVTAKELERITLTQQLPDWIMEAMIEKIETMEPSERDLDYCVQDEDERILVKWN
ncbi:hypothetical protein LKD70_16265 [Ruminococcus sp. CLA-AA-H200]|uniref:Uncharacterized protein n=1 Tax=Ruminococcus turbiniformis TaxID=2881258 RepID=A0ABS8G152_9FIRM|nr:hypothetical protein [Ruminococcus turbiniformis]MCC2255947.1 hypothetical protein [Ruminococcus turbiniformis]